MKTLVLKHNGHEAHVPYELPDSLRFDCFVPGHGIRPAHVDPRGDEFVVTEVEGLSYWFSCHDAVLEQAGDVVRTFLEALPIEWSECRRVDGESDKGWLKRLMLIESSWRASTRPSDMAVLSTIAEMALLESDLHTADLRLPAPVRDEKGAPPDPRTLDDSYAHHRLMRFIHEVLVPRAQDLATAAAKRREAQWNEEQLEERQQGRRNAVSHSIDIAIKAAKERA